MLLATAAPNPIDGCLSKESGRSTWAASLINPGGLVCLILRSVREIERLAPFCQRHPGIPQSRIMFTLSGSSASWWPCGLLKARVGDHDRYPLAGAEVSATSLSKKSTLDANDTAILYKPCCSGGRTLEPFARAGLREHYRLMDCTHSGI
jgi:hypothetical protein